MSDPALRDHLRILVIVAMRKLQSWSIGSWSRWTFRRRPGADATVPVTAVRDWPGFGDMPAALRAPAEVPDRGRLGKGYVLPYYDLITFLLRRGMRRPIEDAVAWRPGLWFTRWFPPNAEGWGNVNEDAPFAALRLRGPNPYLLTRHGDAWVCDYRAAFAGLAPDVVCTFDLDGAELVPRDIAVDGVTHRPGVAGWRRAKRLANALDARYVVFVRHLLFTHLQVGQAHALAALQVPTGHPLRSFLDVFTFGTMHVNHFAITKLVGGEMSYFYRSRFISRPEFVRLLENALPTLSLDDLIPRRDAARRGLDAIPDAVFVSGGVAVWDAFEAFTADFVDGWLGGRDPADDPTVVAWFAALLDLLPITPPDLRPLTRETLVTHLTCLLHNNVKHEITGDFSAFALDDVEEVKRVIDFTAIRSGEDAPWVRLSDVVLFDQGAFAGMFNTAGNNLLRTPLGAWIDDPALLARIEALRDRLRTIAPTIAAANARRPYPMLRMSPDQWELSVSF